MYFAKGLKDFLTSSQLDFHFFESLDTFHINYIEMCFKQRLDERMGMLTEVEKYNYRLFQEYKTFKFEELFGLDDDFYKSVA